MKNHPELENVSPETNAVDSQQTEGRRTIIYGAAGEGIRIPNVKSRPRHYINLGLKILI